MNAVNKDSCNWYGRGLGHPRLVKVLAEEYAESFGRNLAPMKEVMTTIGAYEAIYCAVTAFVNEGDEVIVIDPCFDCYASDVKLCGGSLVRVPLRASDNALNSKDWAIDPTEFEAAFTSKTKALIINTPSNPVGKMFSRTELEYIASVCIKHDILCISDEVYDKVVFDGNEHVRIASLPGMWERTITCQSAGKTFGVTGWRIGWAFGDSFLIEQMFKVCVCTTFTAPTLLQEAIAEMYEHEQQHLGTDESYFTWFPRKLNDNLKKLADAFSSVGMRPVHPDGGYFMLIDISDMNWDFGDKASGRGHDVDVVKWLTREYKLATIPTSVFYGEEWKHLGTDYIRVCLAKQDKTIDKAIEIIKTIKKGCAVV